MGHHQVVTANQVGQFQLWQLSSLVIITSSAFVLKNVTWQFDADLKRSLSMKVSNKMFHSVLTYFFNYMTCDDRLSHQWSPSDDPTESESWHVNDHLLSVEVLTETPMSQLPTSHSLTALVKTDVMTFAKVNCQLTPSHFCVRPQKAKISSAITPVTLAAYFAHHLTPLLPYITVKA